MGRGGVGGGKSGWVREEAKGGDECGRGTNVFDLRELVVRFDGLAGLLERTLPLGREQVGTGESFRVVVQLLGSVV